MKTLPMSKIEMMERSMRCFGLGLASLIPGIGIPMAVVALMESRRVERGSGAMWNPAERYLKWGWRCVLLAILLNCATFFLIWLIASRPWES
jgi:hypothetical protein